MGLVADYNAEIARQTALIQAWMDAAPGNAQAFREHNGRSNALQYVEEYSHKWGITAFLAMDLDMPEAAAMMEALAPYEELQDLMD
jgi:hypothetical protein